MKSWLRNERCSIGLVDGFRMRSRRRRFGRRSKSTWQRRGESHSGIPTPCYWSWNSPMSWKTRGRRRAGSMNFSTERSMLIAWSSPSIRSFVIMRAGKQPVRGVPGLRRRRKLENRRHPPSTRDSLVEHIARDAAEQLPASCRNERRLPPANVVSTRLGDTLLLISERSDKKPSRAERARTLDAILA